MTDLGERKPDLVIAVMEQHQTPTSVAAGASAGSSTKPRHFEYAEGSSNKFWEISQAGNAMTARWGRIGSNGQSKTKIFASEATAANFPAKGIEGKTGEGYVERER